MKQYTNYSLKDHNTLKIDVSCDEFMLIEHDEDVVELSSHPLFRSGSFFILGDGANVLFTQDIHKLVIHDSRSNWQVVEESDTHTLVKVDAGMSWHSCVEVMVDHGWGGIENMALIPGTVGGAAFGNIAAYGQNFSDVCDGVDVVMHESGELMHLSGDACEFAYRESIFKHALRGKCFISAVYMKLAKNPELVTSYWSKKHGTLQELLAERGEGPYTIKDMFEVITAFRRRRFPDMSQYGTAGSFFKNPEVTPEELRNIQQLVPDVQFYPLERLSYDDDNTHDVHENVKISAGQILDAGLGLAGHWEGNVGLHDKHALILVTNGKATGAEVDAFAQSIEKAFHTYCGVHLQREVITV